MEAVAKVRGFLTTWSSTGQQDCRKFLTSLHSNPVDPKASNALATAHHALLSATLTTWPSGSRLGINAFVVFMQSLLHAFPSSSHDASPPASNAHALSEYLVDALWALDAQLEEVLGDTKSSSGQDGASSSLAKSRDNTEADKAMLVELVRQLLRVGILDPGMCRERLDMALVASAGLINDKPNFDRREVRARTGLFYKQNKFNLLREQSEGFSKLITEITSALPPPHSTSSGRPTESKEAMLARVQPVWEHVVSLIGHFDLDPNRALDVILDVFSVHMAAHWSFFLALLSLSPWKGDSGAFTWTTHEEGEPSVSPVESEQYRGKTLDEVLTLAEGSAARVPSTATPTPGAKVMAQVLGFKFRHYQSPDVTESTPRQLDLMAALLIRENFIALEDLYPHLSPSDEDMEEKEHKAYLASVDSRIAAAKISQLAMAAPLESASAGSKPRPPAATEPKVTTPEVKVTPNQKLGLLTALLSLGALRPAFAILSKFPWMTDAHPEIADLLIRVLKYSVTTLYETKVPHKERNTSYTQPRTRYGAAGVLPPPVRKPTLTLWAPTPPCTSALEYVYFFPNWTERVPTCSTLDDLMDVVEPIMRFVGLHVSRDTLFLTKLLRLSKQHFQPAVVVDPITKKPTHVDHEHPISMFWMRILRQCLLPALPLIRGNAVCTVEIWNIVRQFETTIRWRLYGEWKSHIYQSHPELRVRAVQADRESKGILRRLSHNSIDTLSGTVAKLAHSNPCIFFANAVNQIMAYDNLAGVVIQALRYVTNMGFDVLVYIILDALANPHKDRVKDDGVNTSDWLQSLASFTGMLFRRYSADLTPLLKYVVHQLYNGQTTEIIVLRELIWKMAGIEPLPSLSDPQIAAMAGGPALRIEAVASSTRGARLDPGDAVLKGPTRLGKALLDSSLALPLLIQVAQQRQSAVFKIQDAHLKSLASLYDTTHGVLLQYLELLTTPSVISPEDYASKVVPTLGELGETYGICPPICMQIMRPIFHSALRTAALALEEQERIASEQAEKRLKAALAAKRDPTSVASRVASPAVGESVPATTKDISEESKSLAVPDAKTDEDVVMENSDAAPPVKLSQADVSPWVPELLALFEDVKRIIPKSAHETIGPAFYLTFWQLSTYDLSPPSAKYDEEGAALAVLSRQENSKYISADRSSDRAKRLGALAHRQRRDRYNQYADALVKELKEQTASRVFTIKRLAREKSHWFAHGPRAAPLVLTVIEHCIQPRCLLSPMDADFCAQFIKVIHTLGTPGFSTLMVYDKLLGDQVRVVAFSCSEYEAKNYGRFLHGVLTDLHKWYQDEQQYTQDNRVKVNGKAAWLPGFLQKPDRQAEPIEASAVLSWSSFQTIMRKWHKKLYKSFSDCIQTGEYMHVYNAIIVLKEILPVFPLASVSDAHGPNLSHVMETFIETEERGDLKILARAYHASLKKREPYWAPPKSAIAKPHVSSASPRPTTPLLPGSDRTRTPVSTSNTTSNDKSRPSAPLAPRAQHPSTNGADKNSPAPSLTKAAMDSIPRPELVRRVRPEQRSDTPTQAGTNGKAPASRSQPTEVDPKPSASKPLPREISDSRPQLKDVAPPSRPARDVPPIRPPTSSSISRPEVSSSDASNALRRAPSGPSRDALYPAPISTNLPPSKPPPQSPRSYRMDERPQRRDSQPIMAPPSNPSQTSEAHELRETAKLTTGRKTEEQQQSEDRPPRAPPSEPRYQNGGSRAPSPRRRSTSPPTRPGTRNGSVESRNSGERSRSDRGDNDRDDKSADREGRSDTRAPERRESLSHRSERKERGSARDSDREKEREKERGRDRHGDRDRDRDRTRDRGERDIRDRDRERERGERGERDKERDRDRDRDRHRRDEKDVDRDSRKEREASARGNPPSDERTGPPSRPDPSRHRNGSTVDESLGKRRRPLDDDPDRASKRSSREKHREDRSRRSAEKDRDHERPPRESSDRRKRERDGPDGSGRPSPLDKPSDKRIPEGPPTPSLPSSTPSAPRAMASADARGPKVDSAPGRERERERERPLREPGSLYPLSFSQGPPSARDAFDSTTLLSRIGARDAARLPQGPSSFRGEPAHFPERGRAEDEHDAGRKRTLSGEINYGSGKAAWAHTSSAERERERERELPLTDSAMSTPDGQPPKRPRLRRNRYPEDAGQGSHALARKLLDVDPHAADRLRHGRKD
ncbi:transcription factor/nuclear export subunit protein 2-domain-containing protein [Amylostereum chailletii]|nr:transcription factor/nuclear export subunit protein 2-domain-containing protein [Amylostereum chailletii]